MSYLKKKGFFIKLSRPPAVKNSRLKKEKQLNLEKRVQRQKQKPPKDVKVQLVLGFHTMDRHQTLIIPRSVT